MSQYNFTLSLTDIIKDLKTRVTALENASGTGWVALSLPAGVSPGSGSVPAVRIVGTIAYLRGAPTITSGSPTFWASIPAAARPVSTATYGPLIEGVSGGVAGFLVIDASTGQISGTSSFGTGETANLDGLSFPLN
jgi:hypothetical protein